MHKSHLKTMPTKNSVETKCAPTAPGWKVNWVKAKSSRDAVGVSKSPTALVNVRSSTGIRHIKRSVPQEKIVIIVLLDTCTVSSRPRASRRERYRRHLMAGHSCMSLPTGQYILARKLVDGNVSQLFIRSLY
jgi:hypothetical protein